MKQKTEIRLQAALFALSVGTFLVFGLHHLTRFVTADEHYWLYERIPQYWKAVSEHRWKKTFINDKPGITLALVSGAGLFLEPHPETHPIPNDRKLELYRTERTERINLVFRLPILVLNALFLAYLFWIVGKLSGDRWIALWTVMGAALSPILIGISQIVNPDALLWTFSTAAFFTYLASLRIPERKYLLLTGLFLGFAILSKYTATILYPSFALFATLSVLFHKTEPSRNEASSLAKRHAFGYLAVVAVSLAVIAFFLPAVVARPKNAYELLVGFSDTMPWVYVGLGAWVAAALSDGFLLEGRLTRSFFRYGTRVLPALGSAVFALASGTFVLLLAGRNFMPRWPLFDDIPFDIKETRYFDQFPYVPNLAETFLLNANPFVFSLPPAVVVLLLFLWIRRTFRSEPETLRLPVFAATAFLPIFFAANALAGVVATVRYDIVLYPLAAFLAAASLRDVSMRLSLRKLPLLAVSFVLYGTLAVSAFLSGPFYFNYTSSLLPKDRIVTDAWGYGGYEAAQYLNSLPDAEKLVVWADYYGVCEFIKGTCITDYRYRPGEYRVDYYVLTRRGGIRYNPDHIQWRSVSTIEPYKYYGRNDPVWELFIDGRPDNFIRVYRAQ
jgi:4-amino-4-deoxy-L-arabinose transferase-like glycosyltransferase